MGTRSGAAPDGWYAGGERLRAGGYEHFLREEGDGEPLLLLHGFPTCSWDWRLVWDDLAGSHRVFAPDLLGFGRSEKPRRASYSIAAQADRVLDLLRARGVDRFHVLAHDYGDTVVQELLARDRADGGPGRVLSACFLNGGLFPEANRPLPVQHLLRSPAGALLGPLVPFLVFRRAFPKAFGPDTRPDSAELRACWDLVEHGGGRRVVHRILGYLDEREEHRSRWVEAVRGAACPVALVNGPADRISGAYMLLRWRELVPDGIAIELGPGVGHYPQLESPEGVLEAYRDLWEGRS